MSQLSSHAQVVVIGDGIVGCSMAYHLVEQGWKDVVFKYGADLFAGLEAKTG